MAGTTRSASSPIYALLNYLYAILEAEVQLAILGLDSGMGILHADLNSRDSFGYDVIEPLRPVIDGQLLNLLERRTFGRRQFFETRQGGVSVNTSADAGAGCTPPNMAKPSVPVVEQVAQHLAEGQGTGRQPLTIPTRLTRGNRSVGRDGVLCRGVRKTRREWRSTAAFAPIHGAAVSEHVAGM